MTSKKTKQKKPSENDQSTGHFQSFFFHPPGPLIWKNKKQTVNQLIKKFWPYWDKGSTWKEFICF